MWGPRNDNSGMLMIIFSFFFSSSNFYSPTLIVFLMLLNMYLQPCGPFLFRLDILYTLLVLVSLFALLSFLPHIFSLLYYYFILFNFYLIFLNVIRYFDVEAFHYTRVFQQILRRGQRLGHCSYLASLFSSFIYILLFLDRLEKLETTNDN